jgi:hypothetical protein
MNASRGIIVAAAGLLAGTSAVAHEPGLTAPQLVMKESVAGMPRGDRQEVAF